MKRVLLGALVVLTGFADARSVRSVKLELKSVPVRQLDGRTTYIQLLADGEVLGSRCQPKIGPRACDVISLDRLSKSELRRIDRLIGRADRAELILPDPRQPICKALPSAVLTYSAANGSVLLKSGPVPCGHKTVRDGKAAEELIEILNDYRREFNQIEQHAELE